MTRVLMHAQQRSLQLVFSFTLFTLLTITTASYSTLAGQNPGLIAQAAISNALTATVNAKSFISKLSDPSYTNELKDCVEQLDEAASEVSDSVNQMKQIVAAGWPPRKTSEFGFWVSNVQTWMSAAATYEDTCKDGFNESKGPSSSPVKDKVIAQIDQVLKVTSNALGLVNKAYN